MFQVILLFMLNVPLSGCFLLNGVNSISPVYLRNPERDRAMVIFGLRVVRPLLGLMSLIMISLLPGCVVLNDVNPLEPKDFLEKSTKPPANRALVIFAVGIEGTGYHPYTRWFSIHMDEYSMERQNVTGNCWRSNTNTMEAKIPGVVGTFQYFMFDVKPGFYVAREWEDPFHKTIAFEIPEGKLTYLGDFVWTKEFKVEHTHEPGAVRAFFGEDLILAEMQQVPRPTAILCVP